MLAFASLLHLSMKESPSCKAASGIRYVNAACSALASFTLVELASPSCPTCCFLQDACVPRLPHHVCFVLGGQVRRTPMSLCDCMWIEQDSYVNWAGLLCPCVIACELTTGELLDFRWMRQPQCATWFWNSMPSNRRCSPWVHWNTWQVRFCVSLCACVRRLQCISPTRNVSVVTERLIQ